MMMALTVSIISVESLLEGAMCAVALWTGRKLKRGVLRN